MKTNDLNDLKKKTIRELNQKLKDLNKEKLEVAIESKMGKVKNVHSGKMLKKDIAKVMTIIKLKQIAENAKPKIKEVTKKEAVNVAN